MLENFKKYDLNQPRLTKEDLGEIYRLVALAQTHYEDAAMWAVKAATA